MQEYIKLTVAVVFAVLICLASVTVMTMMLAVMLVMFVLMVTLLVAVVVRVKLSRRHHWAGHRAVARAAMTMTVVLAPRTASHGLLLFGFFLSFSLLVFLSVCSMRTGFRNGVNRCVDADGGQNAGRGARPKRGAGACTGADGTGAAGSINLNET